MQKNYTILISTMRMAIGGAETHILELAKGLHAEGFRVLVASNGGVYEKELEANGIRHFTVPLSNKKPQNLIKSYKLLKQIIIDEKVDIVHAQARIPGFICGILHKKLHFPFVTTAHGTWNTGWGLRYITNWGQKTVAVSEDVKRYLLDNYKIKPENIKLTINGIDTEKFSPDTNCSDILNELGLREESIKIVYISRLDNDRKDIIYQLLDLIPELANKINNLSVIMVGGGTLLTQIREKASSINSQTGKNTLIVTGPRIDINKFTALSDLFIGFGRSSLEALAAARPLILAGNQGYIGILNEEKLDKAIKSNFSGRGEGKAENEAFISDILKVLTEMTVEERKNLGDFGRRVIEENYSVKRMVNDNIEVYMKLLSTKA